MEKSDKNGSLPDNWVSFYEEMIKRATVYIKNQYWAIDENTLALWLNNFQKDDEKLLSALIIYRLIYRNKKPMLSMYNHIIQAILPSILEKLALYNETSIDSFINKIETNPWGLNFRFSTITEVDASPSKSGAQLLREFKRDGPFHEKMLFSISNLPVIDPKIKALVFFDDFMGTGEQFDIMLENIKDKINDIQIIYCPLAAHADGIAFIEKKYPSIILAPVEILDDNYNFFNKAHMPKLLENFDINTLKKTYYSLLAKTKLDERKFLGRGEQALTYIFSLSSPNNSLPILTYRDQEINWERLFAR